MYIIAVLHDEGRSQFSDSNTSALEDDIFGRVRDILRLRKRKVGRLNELLNVGVERLITTFNGELVDATY
jgi:hypothetical protein